MAIPGGGWTASTLPVMTLNGTNMSVIKHPTGNMFFRLMLQAPIELKN
jgi:hypothetical protein